MTFDLILEDGCSNKLAFVTITDCKVIDDAIDWVHKNWSGWNIEQIKEVN